MTDKDRYIYNYLNSKSSSISFYVPRILSLQGSELYDCRIRVLTIIDEVKGILDRLQIETVPINAFFNELFLLRNSGIWEVEELLTKYDYKNVMKNSYIGVQNKINANERLTDEDKLCIEFFINSHMLIDENVIEYFLKQALIRDNELSYDTFDVLLTTYAKMRMKKFVSKPVCKILSESSMQGKKGYSIENKMFLSRENFQKLYYMGVYALIKDMFHELCHIKQYREVKIEQKKDPFTLLKIKEEILAHYLEDYYVENFEKISYEVEAELFAITELLKLFAKFGIHFEKDKNPYIDIINRLVTSSTDDLRKTKDGCQSVNEIFDCFIMYHPELLETYPQLLEEYEISFDDLVVRKDDFGRKD